MVSENELVSLIDKDNVIYNVLKAERLNYPDREATLEEIECRKQEEQKEKQIGILKQRLRDYSDDIVQDMAGEIVPDIEKRKLEFMRTHDLLRALLNMPIRDKKGEI